ncbi:MAG: ShlB/FhaC/HecB family hemolysin secretion/activation protein [Methylobacterium sp.]|nr:ShlB/FhaC/HecB family hemolysin secretion/activation protein [Methylobacterium sp.]
MRISLMKADRFHSFRTVAGEVFPCFALFVLGMTIMPGYAAGLPDAGALQRDTTPRTLPEVPVLSPEPAGNMPAATPGEATLTVTRFEIEGATLIPSSELEAQLSDLLGKPLTLPQLDTASLRIYGIYRSRGWFVRVWLPEQEIRHGVVRIAVLEGRLSAVRIGGSEDASEAAFAGKVVAHRLKIGDVLTHAGLERGLLIANDLPGMEINGVLEPGARSGETVLNVLLKPGRTFTGQAFYNNFGYRTTGYHQFGINAAIAPGSGNLITLGGQTSDDLEQISFGFSTPLGYDGARLSLAANALQYDLPGRFEQLGAEGDSTSYSATVSWPWLRSENANLLLNGSINHDRYNDDIQGEALRRRRVTSLAFEAVGNRIDAWGGGGRFDVSLRLIAGDLDTGEVPGDQFVDSRTARADGRFEKLGGRLSRLQLMHGAWSLYAALSGQISTANLNPSEKFTLGGPFAVRAYPVGEAPGDQVALFNLELRREFGSGWRAMAFLDSGRVQINRDTWNGFSGDNTYSLHGAGLGLSWSKNQQYSLDATLAVPIGGNDGALANGKNLDGSERGPRLWASFIKHF